MADKIRAVLLWLDFPVRLGRQPDNGPEWFKDPTRNILILSVAGGAYDEDLPVDDIIVNVLHLYDVIRRQDPPLDVEEVLVITDREGRIELDGSRIPIVRVGHRSLVTIDRITREIYRIEHERKQKEPNL